jgi:hypothetical protein
MKVVRNTTAKLWSCGVEELRSEGMALPTVDLAKVGRNESNP